MPLPEAKPDKRIYKLLKNVDLENLTFDDLQAVGQTIFAEQGAEDELRRLVLVNLARLSTVGEWTGLTSAGGGGGQAVSAPILTEPSIDNNQTAGQPFGTGGAVLDTESMFRYDRPLFYPFLSTYTGDLTELTIRVSTADTTGADMLVGIYDATDGDLPGSLLGSTTFDCSTTGTKTNTGFGTITLTQGELYFFAFCSSQTGSNGVIRTWQSLYMGGRINATGGNPEAAYLGYENNTVTHTLPNPSGVNRSTSRERPVFTML